MICTRITHLTREKFTWDWV